LYSYEPSYPVVGILELRHYCLDSSSLAIGEGLGELDVGPTERLREGGREQGREREKEGGGSFIYHAYTYRGLRIWLGGFCCVNGSLVPRPHFLIL
jgi:hypothetical protein